MTAQSGFKAVVTRAALLDRRRTGLVLLTAIAAVLPLVLGAYHLTILNFIILRAIVVIGLVLLTGFTGQISFGQAAFVAIGAYVSAILSTRYDLSPWLALLIALAAVGVTSAVVGIPLLQLKGHYLALGTLAFGLIVYNGLVEFHDLTGGPSGFGGIPALTLPGFSLDSPRAYAYLLLTVIAVVTWLSLNLVRGRIGRQARAVRDRELTAECLGVHAGGLKLRMFVLAAVYAGLSGSLYVHLVRFVNPSPFDLNYSIELLTMAVLGGLGSVWGGILGAAALTLLTELLRSAIPGTTAEQQVILFGVLLIVMLIFWPQGLAGAVHHAVSWGSRRLRERQEDRLIGTHPTVSGRQLADYSELHRWLIRLREGEGRESMRHTGETQDPLLHVSQLSCRFGGLLALDRLDLVVREGQLLAIIGPNGAGKTTVFNIISGLIRPTGGTVQFAGSEISGAPPYRIARLGVARTFQNVEVLPQMTCLENVLVALEADHSPGFLAALLRPGYARAIENRLTEEAHELLRLVGLADAVYTPAGALPLGKQRLLELARAIARRPRLLLLDEPASGLNPSERMELLHLIEQLRVSGIAVMLVEHAMDFVMSLADYIVVLNRGQKIAEGTPELIRRNPVVIAAYLGEPEEEGTGRLEAPHGSEV